MRFENPGDPVYAPNTAGGPQADEARYGDDATWHTDGEMVRTAYTLRAEDDDYGQPGALVREVMSQTDRANLAANIVGHAARPEVTAEMKRGSSSTGRNVDPDLGAASRRASASGPARRRQRGGDAANGRQARRPVRRARARAPRGSCASAARR